MVALPTLWLAIVLAAFLVFAASSVIHMFLPYHRSDFAPVPSEDGVMEALRRFDIPPGDYVLPHAGGDPEVMKSDARRLVRTPRDLMAQVMAVDTEAGAALMEEASTFSPTIIVNRVERTEQSRLGAEMGSACRDYFGIQLRCLGTLPQDNLVRRSSQVVVGPGSGEQPLDRYEVLRHR